MTNAIRMSVHAAALVAVAVLFGFGTNGEAAGSGDDGCLLCSWQTCGTQPGWHRTNLTYGENVKSTGVQHYGPHDCTSGTCDTHGSCDELPCPDGGCTEEALVTAIELEQPEQIALIVAATQGRTLLNEARLAIQRFDCKGNVITHLNVPAALLSAVESALE